MTSEALPNAVDPSSLMELMRCVHFAALKHKDQRRKDKDKTPYVNHVIGVANILSQEGGVTDLETLQAALLHDTVEDTNTTFEELEREFGTNVTGIVKEVTDDKSLPKEERKRQQILHAPHASFKAKLVKLADKLYNLRDLQRSPIPTWPESRVQEYFVWASQVVAGLRGTNKVLEDSLDTIFVAKGIQLNQG